MFWQDQKALILTVFLLSHLRCRYMYVQSFLEISFNNLSHTLFAFFFSFSLSKTSVFYSVSCAFLDRC